VSLFKVGLYNAESELPANPGGWFSRTASMRCSGLDDKEGRLNRSPFLAYGDLGMRSKTRDSYHLWFDFILFIRARPPSQDGPGSLPSSLRAATEIFCGAGGDRA
jgi:hypothetical protein